MTIKCKHKRYNYQTPYKGNVISNIQYSQCISSWNTLKSNPSDSEKGLVTRYNINSLPTYISKCIKDKLITYAKENINTIVYCIRHYIYTDRADPIIVGYIITDQEYNTLYTTNTNNVKYNEIIEEFKKHVTER